MSQATIAISTDVAGSQLDRAEIERRAKVQSGRPGAQVSAVRERRDDSGKLIAYEVDIR